MDSKNNDSHFHLGHRKRILNRCLKEGIDNFEDHQILELILFFSIPRRDTNVIAHQLLKHFGSLSRIFEENVEELKKQAGIGESSAVFLHLIPSIARVYLRDKIKHTRKILNNPEATHQFIMPLMIGRIEEVFYVICLDSTCKIMGYELISKGTVNEAFVHPRKVVEAVIKHNSSKIIISHNHPSGVLRPSAEDVQFTNTLKTIFSAMGIEVLDHIIVAGEKSYSFRQNNLI